MNLQIRKRLVALLGAAIIAPLAGAAPAVLPQGTPPPPDAMPIAAASEAECLQHPEWANHHPLIDHKPKLAERQNMAVDAGYIRSCVSVWERQCLMKTSASVPGLTGLCLNHSRVTRVHAQNLGSLAFGEIKYTQYNARIKEIDGIADSTDTALLKIAQAHVDDLERAAKARQDSEKTRESAQREEEMIVQLRQLNMQRSATVNTNCNVSGSGTTVQCQSY